MREAGGGLLGMLKGRDQPGDGQESRERDLAGVPSSSYSDSTIPSETRAGTRALSTTGHSDHRPTTPISNPFEDPANVLYPPSHTAGAVLTLRARHNVQAPLESPSGLDAFSSELPFRLSGSQPMNDVAPRERNPFRASTMSIPSDLRTCSDADTDSEPVASSESTRPPSSWSSDGSGSTTYIPMEICQLFPAPPVHTPSSEVSFQTPRGNLPLEESSELELCDGVVRRGYE
ncbi:hypothetical protein GSI_08483 [Ganoderma sinense ZZ0214-1]|uniref:Uncharacterized protein n=1 Tax=Ganoderma sinense ZZ0214-1 TaxID=1077348 RepID=A0A2G8S3U8_9APHY|nr:hypothetical protein GSI_08483 [Ganoderma sinense ZZ0214-1]